MIKKESQRIFAYILDIRDFNVICVSEIINDYEINIDEETNPITNINIILKEKVAIKSDDLIFIKKNGNLIYMGTIDDIENENNENKYKIKCKYINNIFNEDIMLNNEHLIKENGIEDFIAKMINDNFIDITDDPYMNKSYMDISIETHTKIDKSIENQNGIFNLYNFIIECFIKYSIILKFEINNNRLKITISKKNNKLELLNTKAFNISNYIEVFEKNVVSKVKVITTQGTYLAFLLADGSITTNQYDTNRVLGKSKLVYTEKLEEAHQVATDIFNSNIYNHLLTFSLNRLLDLGTKIMIKTNNSKILNTYISSISIKNSNYIDYKCGEMRINFIEKLLKEKK